MITTTNEGLMAMKCRHGEVAPAPDSTSSPALRRLRVNVPSSSAKPVTSQPSMLLEPVPVPASTIADKSISVMPAQPKPSFAEQKLTASDMVNRPVFQVSMAQLADLSPQFRTQIKGALTKPHKKPVKVDNATPMVFAMEQVQNDLPHPPILEERRTTTHAPCTQGTINGRNVEMILDGGATTCIISLNLVKRLGIKELEMADKTILLGDEQVVKPIGIATDLEVILDGIYSYTLDALCLDITSYDFLVGRYALQEMQVGTDWHTHFWWVRNENGVHPLQMDYVTNPAP